MESDGRDDPIMPMTKVCLWCFQVSVFANSSLILDVFCILEACPRYGLILCRVLWMTPFSICHNADIGAYR